MFIRRAIGTAYSQGFIKSQLFYIYNPQIKRFSQVESIRKLEFLKRNANECKNALKQGKFLIFKDKSVLIDKSSLEVFEPKSDSPKLTVNDVFNQYKARWLPYSDLKDLNPQSEEKIAAHSILLGLCNESGDPLFALDITNLNDNLEDKVTSKFEGIFASMPAAVFLGTTENNVTFDQAHSLIRWHVNNKYCPKCGNETVRNQAGTLRQCGSCNKISYPKPDPAAITVVTDEKMTKCLLVRQHNFPKGMFTAVAGFLEMGETIEDTVRREVAEEIGLEVQNIYYICSQHWPLRGSTLMMGFHATVKPGDFSLDTKELEAARWFTPLELKTALNVSKDNALLGFDLNKSNDIWVPPKPTIANYLLNSWLKRCGS